MIKENNFLDTSWDIEKGDIEVVSKSIVIIMIWR